MKKICVPLPDNERLTCFTFKPKSDSVMQGNIALHGLLPKNELPHHLRGKIPPDEIWVHEDTYYNPKDMKDLNKHEAAELFCMVYLGMTYKLAHDVAEVADGAY